MSDIAVLSYGQVKGRFLSVLPDSADTGLLPDAVPMTGKVTFTATARVLTVTSASPAPATIFNAPVTVPLDADGYLAWAGSHLISLLATNDTDANPSTWQWRVDFSLKANGRGVAYPSFYFDLAPNATVDIANLTPILTPSPGTVTLKGDKGDKGDPGPTAGYVHQQTVALSSWSITHPLGRIPNVQVYVGGQFRLAEWTADSTTVSITFPAPVTGYAVLT